MKIFLRLALALVLISVGLSARAAESVDQTVITGAGIIVNATGHTFAINSSKQISIDGTPDASTSNVIEIAYVNHVLWQENSSLNWYSYNGTPGSYTGPTKVSPLKTITFAQMLGVDVHISQGTVGYSDATTVNSDLQYLGIRNLRDSYNTGRQTVFASVAGSGNKFTFISSVGGTLTNSDITGFLTAVNSFVGSSPGSVNAIEGPNEVNNFALTYNGVSGITGAVNYQTDLFTAVRADTSLLNVPVYYFTGYNAGSIGVGPNPATTLGLADFDTQHPYPNNGQPPLIWINRTQALGNENPPTGPAVYTETGYSSNTVSTTVQAKYTLDLLMDSAQIGIAQTYLYELLEEGDGYGLFDATNTPKPVATAIHNLTTILGDAAPSMSAASYTSSGQPASGHDMALMKSNGSTDIVVWAEPQISGTTAGPLTNVTITLGTTYPLVTVYDPLAGTTATQTFSNTNSVIVGVTDHPLIVEVTSSGIGKTSPPAPLTGTVTAQTWVSFDQSYPGVTLTSGKPFHFNVLPPAQLNANAYKYPLLVWLHPDGSGNKWYTGQNTNPFFYIPNEPSNFNTVSFLTNYPGYVLVPYADQTCSAGSAICNWGGWINNGTTGSGTNFSGDTGPNVFALLATINYLQSIYSIDPGRIYCEGFSLGGIGCEYLLLKYNAYNGNPKVFAAGSSTGGVLEIHGAGAGPTAADASTMANIPVWWFSGANDGTSLPADWNLPMWRLLAGNSNYPPAITSPTANQAGTSQMRFTLCATCGHQETDSAGNPVYTNATIMNWMYGITSTPSTGTGHFQVVNGQLLDPSGKKFFAQGVNAYSTSLPNPSTLLNTFPGTNFLRWIARTLDDPTTYDSFVNALPGVIIEFEHHPNGGGGQDASPPDMTIAQESAWYASMATHFKNNPYVWFGTYNEPAVTTPGLSNWQRATYDAIRNTGNVNPLLIEVAGSRPINLQQGLVPATYSTMTNVLWDVHVYGYQNNYSSDPTSIANNISGMISTAQTITSADGIMPVIIGESGTSTTGSSLDPNGQATVNGLIAAATARQMAGYIPFTWWPGFASPNDLTLADNSVTSPYGTSVKAFLATAPTPSETLSVNTIPTVAPNTPFQVSGSIVNATSAPVLQYQNNNGGWITLPAGSQVSNISFSFTDPGLTTAGTSNNTVSVRDANSTSITATSNNFTVTGTESPNNTVVTASLTPTTFSDNFTSLSLHRTWQAGDKWQLISPDTPDGRGGPNFVEAGDQWWTNPFNPSTLISGLYNQDTSGLHLGLMQTPSANAAYINTTAGATLPYVGGLLNTSQTNYQKYGYWEITAAVPAVPGFTFQADAENVQITGTWPPEIDLRVSTAANGVQTVLFEIAHGGGVYDQYTTSSTLGFNASVSHTYAWDWESNFITFYIDNAQVAQFPNPGTAYTTNPMFLFMLTGANYIGNGDPAAATLPVSANVTSVNIYATKPASTSSGSIVDSIGEVWTLTSGGQVAVGGVADATTSNAIELAYVNHVVWYETSGGLWRSKTKASDTWQPTAGTTTSPLTITESPNNTIVTSVGPVITDATGNTFGISSGAQVVINGVADGATSRVIELAYVNHVLWQENASFDWYSYNGTPGSYTGPTQTSPLNTEVLTIFAIPSQLTGTAFTISGSIGGTNTVPTLQYQDNNGAWQNLPGSTAPQQAVNAGFTTQTYGPDIQLNVNIWCANGMATNTAHGIVITNEPNANNATCLTANDSFGNFANGIAFGGGGYFEATLSWTGTAAGGGWPSWWFGNHEYTVAGASGTTQWPGQAAGYGHWIEPDIMEYGNNTGNVNSQFGSAYHDWYGTQPNPPHKDSNIPRVNVANAATSHKYGLLWEPATATTPGHASYWFDGVKEAGSDIYWNKFSSSVGPPPPAFCTALPIAASPACTAGSEWDNQHIVGVFGTPSNMPMTVTSLNVWQKDGTGNLGSAPLIGSSGGGGNVTTTTFSFLHPGMAANSQNVIRIRDANAQAITATSNTFQVTATTTESIAINAIPQQIANTPFSVQGTIANATGIPTLQYENNGGTWNPLPTGAQVTNTTFNFTNPGLAANASATVGVRDANNTSTAVVSSFVVAASGGVGAISWNPSDTSSSITLSGNNLIATSGSTVQGGSRSTTSHTSSGKFCTDLVLNTVTPNMAVGLSNAAYALSGTVALGANTNGVGFSPAQPNLLQGALYNGVQILPPGIGHLTPTSGGSIVALGHTWTLNSTGVFQDGVIVPSSGNTAQFTIVNNVIYGQDATSLAWFTYSLTTQQWTAASAPTAAADVSGDTVTMCEDLVAQQAWISTPSMRRVAGVTWNSSLTANPATGVGGISFGGLACPCFVTVETKDAGTQVTIDTTGPIATGLPTGYQVWQPVPTIIHHPFTINLGQNTLPANDNYPYVPVRFERIAQ